MNNLINAKELFELKREANSKGLKFSAYRDTIEYSNELSNELLYMLCDVLCYHGFDVSSKKINWIKHIPQNFSGVIIGNEFLDALPFNIYEKKGKLFENVRKTLKRKQKTPDSNPNLEWLDA